MRMLPVVFRWDAGTLAMTALARYANVARRQFGDGEEYPLVIVEVRTRASHDQFFASVREAFDNLPEKVAARWPTDTHLRRWVLIETGWFDEEEFEADSEANARKMAAFVRKRDDYARISVHGRKVIVRTAKSQSAVMGKQAFEDSKRDVLDYLATMVGVTAGALKKNAGRSA